MKVLINGITYDSTETPILLLFDENEQDIFNGMKRFVSAPENTTEQQRQELIDTDVYIEQVKENDLRGQML